MVYLDDSLFVVLSSGSGRHHSVTEKSAKNFETIRVVFGHWIRRETVFSRSVLQKRTSQCLSARLKRRSGFSQISVPLIYGH